MLVVANIHCLGNDTCGVRRRGTPRSLSLDWQSRVTPRVQQIWKSTQNLTSSIVQPNGVDSGTAARQASSSVRYDSKGRLQIDVLFEQRFQ
jgi:hypothetical protein